MALLNLARTRTTTTTTKHTLFLPIILHHLASPFPSKPTLFTNTPKPCLFSSSSPINFSPSTPFQSFQIPISKTYFQNHHFSPFETPPDQYLYESSDFEDNGDEQFEPETARVDDLLKILDKIKQLSSEEEAMAVLEQSGITPTEHLVYKLLFRLRYEYKLAVLVFKWAGSNPYNDKLQHLMIWILGKHKRFDIAWRLIRIMHQSSMVTAQTLLIMIKRYAAANEPHKAIKTFHAMDKFKIIADSTSLYTLLHALCKHGNIEEAEELLFLNKTLFPLETEGFNIVLNGWCNIAVDVVEAKRVWREMSNCCIDPDVTSYTHMICCFSKVRNLFDSLRLYDEMKKKGLVPGLVVYNSLIYVLARENCINRAANLFDKIREVGLEPDLTTYNSIIYPLCEAQKLEEAYCLLDDMTRKGLVPNIGTYHAFARAETFGGTLKLLTRMKEVNCGPNAGTFLVIIDKFFKLGQTVNALKMWVEMGKHGIVPESMHYTAMVNGLLSCSRHGKAREFYDEMRSKGFQGDPKLEKLLKDSAEKNKVQRQKQEKNNKAGTRAFCPKYEALEMKVGQSIKNVRTSAVDRIEHDIPASGGTQKKNPHWESIIGRIINHLKD